MTVTFHSGSMRSLRRLIALLVCGLCGIVSASAQTTPCPSPCTLTVGQAYGATSTHDGVNTTGYRIYVDGAKVGADVPLSALSAGTVTVSTLIAPARGTHTLQFAAFNEDAESTKSDAFTLSVKKAAPGKPGLPQVFTLVVSIAENGRLSFQLVPADQ